MANMSLNVNMENLTEAERNQLLALVKKSTGENKVWKPEYDEKYYYIDVDGECYLVSWNDSDINNNLYTIGNCFKTKEEAEFAVEKQKVTTELKRFAQKHNDKINWHDNSDCNNDNWKYSLAYDYRYKKLTVCSTIKMKLADIYFTSKEIAQQAIKAIGADRLKKYYFEVED